LEEALRGLQSRLDEKNQSLQADIAPDLPQVYAEASRLVQVLAYLLDNASRYTPAGGEIRVTARQQEAVLRLEVIDTGIGISQQDQASLFSQFFRSGDPAVHEQPGWGLALSVAKRLVVLMGGEIGVRSELGQGSAFWFTLPAGNPGH
jgi:signal transduction histidine kinase